MTTENRDVRIAILGSGSMGTLFAGRLAPVANVAVFGTWQEQLEALSRGAELVLPDGSIRHFQVETSSDPDTAGKFDLILVLVKSFQTPRAAQWAATLLDRSSPFASVLTLQNGAGNRELIAASVGSRFAQLGITTQAANLSSIGKVEDTGRGPVFLAEDPHHPEGIRKWHEVLTLAGFEVRISGEVESLVWGKLAINAGINPLTALLDVPNGELARDPDLRRIMILLGKEVFDTARKLGISLPFPDVAQRLTEVVESTAENISSMRRDVRRGSKTEIHAICGYIAAAAKESGGIAAANEWALEKVLGISREAYRPWNRKDLISDFEACTSKK